MTIKVYPALRFVVVLMLSACGSSEEAAQEQLNANILTLSPSPGTYTYKPWIKVSREDSGIGSGVFKVKGPSDSDFRDHDLCYHAPYENLDVLKVDCMEISESGEWKYKLENSEASSDVTEVEFTINLTTNNISVTSKAGTNATNSESFELTEVETFCKYGTDGKLFVLIQTQQSDKIGSDKYAYFAIELNSPETGNTVTVSHENTSVSGGIQILPISDDRPISNSYFTDNYSTVQSSGEEASCTFTFTEAERGMINKGTFSCSGLANYSSSVDSSKIPLGKILDISGNWQCDRYRQ